MQIFPVRLRLQAHIGAPLAHLAQQVRRRPARQRLEWVFQTRRDDALVGAEHGHLQRPGGAALLVDAVRDILGGGVEQRVRKILGVARILAHAQIQRGARQHQRIVQALLHLDLKPAVDAAIQELQREQIHDEQRRDHQRAENGNRARRQARAGNVRAIVAHELPDLAREQRDERR